MKPFTRDDAYDIALKLGARIEKRTNHDWVIVEYGGRVVAQYGIRRASREASHLHIPPQLYISPHNTRKLADCEFSKEWYFSSLQEQGRLTKSSPST